jgi:hypothetical protein
LAVDAFEAVECVSDETRATLQAVDEPLLLLDEEGVGGIPRLGRIDHDA